MSCVHTMGRILMFVWCEKSYYYYRLGLAMLDLPKHLLC